MVKILKLWIEISKSDLGNNARALLTKTSVIRSQGRYSSPLQPGVVGETTKERSESKYKVRKESVRDDSIFRRRDPR